ncbi:F-box protein FBW2 [Dendrobium catenatum]|uniref:F-box protein FBW2 n=1 Tax=Dendrobium catenatum TaxID=906689 RepID=A0A2I0V9R1_9ASPA|nr:F-box protein FBW2 [Dendrobium catenatum]
MVRTISFVCKSWQEAVTGPCCWTDINIEEWCRHVNNPDVIDTVVRKLVRRSRYKLRRLSAYRIQNNEREALAIANTMFGLEQLELAFGRFSDYGLAAILSNCKALSFLDLSGCQYVKLEGDVGSKFYALKSYKEPFSDFYESFPSNVNDNDDNDDDNNDDDDDNDNNEEHD